MLRMRQRTSCAPEEDISRLLIWRDDSPPTWITTMSGQYQILYPAFWIRRQRSTSSEDRKKSGSKSPTCARTSARIIENAPGTQLTSAGSIGSAHVRSKCPKNRDLG